MNEWPNLCLLAQRIGRPIYVIDLETTGFVNPGVVEIACLKAMGNGNVTYKSTLVNPERRIDPRATAVHGISMRDVKDSKNLSHWLDFLANACKNGIVSGFNIVGYDLRVLRDNALHYKHSGIGEATALDARDLWKNVSGSSKGKLVDVAQHYGVKVENAHRALGDTLMTAHVLEAMLIKHGHEVAIKNMRNVAA